MLISYIEDKRAMQLRKVLESAENIVLTCHVRPDGDAIGSTLGLYYLLLRMGKNPNVIVPDKAPRSLSFLKGYKDIVTYSQYKEFADDLINKADLIICCDFNKLSRLDVLSNSIENAKCEKILIDHHIDPDNFTDITFSYHEMSSTCELVFRLIAAMGLIDMIDKNCATAICTGIVTDTRNLSVNCNYPDIYIIMYELLKMGVDKQKIVKESLETKSYDSIKLCAYAISEKLTVYEAHKAAVVILDKDELQRYNYVKGDSEGLVNEPLEISGVKYSFFLREDSDCIKVSARSIDNFPVNKICEKYFNGGGHVQASGGEFYGTLKECEEILIKAMPEFDKYLNNR